MRLLSINISFSTKVCALNHSRGPRPLFARVSSAPNVAILRAGTAAESVGPTLSRVASSSLSSGLSTTLENALGAGPPIPLPLPTPPTASLPSKLPIKPPPPPLSPPPPSLVLLILPAATTAAARCVRRACGGVGAPDARAPPIPIPRPPAPPPPPRTFLSDPRTRFLSFPVPLEVKERLLLFGAGWCTPRFAGSTSAGAGVGAGAAGGAVTGSTRALIGRGRFLPLPLSGLAFITGGRGRRGEGEATPTGIAAGTATAGTSAGRGRDSGAGVAVGVGFRRGSGGSAGGTSTAAGALECGGGGADAGAGAVGSLCWSSSDIPESSSTATPSSSSLSTPPSSALTSSEWAGDDPDGGGGS